MELVVHHWRNWGAWARGVTGTGDSRNWERKVSSRLSTGTPGRTSW